MNRLLVALLAALDAVLAAAGGIAAALAPLTLLWVLGFDGTAPWDALWPASAVLWQLGHLVPVAVHLPDTYLAVTGIDPAAADFVLSLAPLAFAAFTSVFAARSGGRAARAGEALTGAISASVVFAGLTAAVAFTSGAGPATVELWQALLLPALVFAVPCALGAACGAWIAGGSTLRARVETTWGRWAPVPGLIVRGTATAALGLIAIGAIVLAVAVFAGAGQIVALFQAANVDLLGAVVLALGQLVYLPTLLVWALSFTAGPGFSLGVGTAVSPSGTQLGVLPGIPVLGAVPESLSPWLLLLALAPVGVGAFTGWMLRSRLVAEHPGSEPYGPRLVVLAGTTALTGGFAALLAWCAGGSLGPGRLAEVGPEPGPVAAAAGLEVAVGLAILLLSPRRRGESAPPLRDAPYDLPADRPALAPMPLPSFPERSTTPDPVGGGSAWHLPVPDADGPAGREPEPDAGPGLEVAAPSSASASAAALEEPVVPIAEPDAVTAPVPVLDLAPDAGPDEEPGAGKGRAPSVD